MKVSLGWSGDPYVVVLGIPDREVLQMVGESASDDSADEDASAIGKAEPIATEGEPRAEHPADEGPAPNQKLSHHPPQH